MVVERINDRALQLVRTTAEAHAVKELTAQIDADSAP